MNGLRLRRSPRPNSLQIYGTGVPVRKGGARSNDLAVCGRKFKKNRLSLSKIGGRLLHPPGPATAFVTQISREWKWLEYWMLIAMHRPG